MQIMRKLRSTIAALALPVAAFLVVANAAPAAAESKPIRIGASSTSLVMLPMLLADVDKSIFEAQGLALEFKPLPGGNNCFAALFAGDVDVCVHGTTSGTDAVANGGDLKVIAVTTGPITEIVLSSKTAQRLGVSETTPIEQKLKALDGLRISVIGFHEVTLNAMLKPVSMSVANNIKPLRLSDALTMMESIRNDQIDAAMWSIGALGGVQADGTGIRFISIPRGDAPGMETLPTVSFFVQNKWLEGNAETAAKIQTAVAASIAKLRADPAATSTSVKAKYGAETPQAIWDDAYGSALKVLYEGAKAKRAGWDLLMQVQTESTGQNYTNAAFDKLVAPQARAD